MNTFEILSLVLGGLIPVSFVIGYHTRLKIDITKLQVTVENLTNRIDKLENKIDECFNIPKHKIVKQ